MINKKVTLYKKAGCKFIIPKREQFIIDVMYEQTRDLKKQAFTTPSVVDTGPRVVNIDEMPAGYKKSVTYCKFVNAVDIGAHVGSFSIFFAKFCHDIVFNKFRNPGPKIYAFEPDPENYKLLLTNIFLNHLQERIIPFNIGLSDKIGWERLYKAKNSGQRSTVYKEAYFPVVGDIPVIDLKTLFAITGNIGYLKCDVEGAEFKIFSKLTPKLAEKIKYLNIEVHPFADKKYFDKEDHQKKFLNILTKAGFNHNEKPHDERYFIQCFR